VWRRLCLALPLSLSTSRFLLLVARLHGKTPKLSPPVPPTCPRPCFRLPGTHAKRRLCVIRLLCAYQWHPQFTARTARYSEWPAQMGWTRSTQWTSCYRPPGVRLWRLFCLVLLLKSHFYTQLAPQHIKPPPPESAQIQECQCVCGLCLKLCTAHIIK
jgi:hypothetical protein